MKQINAVLFDLDGTLLDTAADLNFALNKLRQQHDLHPLPISEILPLISLGSISMVKHVLQIDDDHPHFQTYRQQFFDFYQEHLADATQFYPHIENVLCYLDDHEIPWGIVTNKSTRHTLEILKALEYAHRPVCVVCGDTLSKYKPDPAPILHACELMQKKPSECLFVGDSINDIIAGKNAGTQTLVALYGYISPNDDPSTWQADGYIKKPLEILQWLEK